MAIKQKEKTVGDNVISTTSFGGRRGLKLKLRLMSIVGPALAKAVSSASKDDDGDVDIDFAGIGTAVETLMGNVENDKAFNLIRDLLATTYVNGLDLSRDENFDSVFASEYDILYKCLFFVIEVNYGKLFKLGAIGKLVQEKLKMASKNEESTNTFSNDSTQS